MTVSVFASQNHSMDASAQAQSAAPAKSKSPSADTKSAPLPEQIAAMELNYGAPIELDAATFASPIGGNSNYKSLRVRPTPSRFQISGSVDGLVERMRLYSNGLVEIRICQLASGFEREPGDTTWVIVAPGGTVCEVSSAPRPEGKK